jgi:hypothetical protein
VPQSHRAIFRAAPDRAFWGTGDKGIIERLKLGPVGPEEFISYKPTDPAEIALLRIAQHID